MGETRAMLGVLIVLGVVALTGAVPTLNLASWLPIPDGTDRFLPFINTADRMALDAQEGYLYVIGEASLQLHIVDISDYRNPSIIFSRTFDEVTDGGRPSAVTVCRSSNRAELAIAFRQDERNQEGHVETFRPWERFDQNLPFRSRYTTDIDPVAVKYDSSCTTMVVACEGRPANVNENIVDPTVHIDVITQIVDGVNRQVVNFGNAAGLNNIRQIFSDPSNAAHSILNDLEPSDLAIDENNNVYVTFFKNNAIGKFSLNDVQNTQEVFSLGVKDWRNFDIDTSDRDTSIDSESINRVRRNIRSFHQPKRIDIVPFGGDSFVLTANTGGFKSYTLAQDGVNFNEALRARLVDDNLLDPAMDQATKNELNTDSQMGRLFVSTLQQESEGWNPIFGYFEHMTAYGARSWGIWNTVGLTEVYDSGDSMEYQMSLYSRPVFNGDCFGNNMSPVQHLDTRSDDMGIEPTAIAHGDYYNGVTLVAIGSGRSGGIWLYNMQEGEVNNVPTGVFDSYYRFGDINGNWRQLYDSGEAGVQYISDLVFHDDNGQVLLIALGSQMCAVAIMEVNEDTFPRTS